MSLAESRIASAAINDPDPVTIAALGPRPSVGDHRRIWDAAIGDAAIYRARWQTNVVTTDGSVEQVGAGDSAGRFEHYERVQAAVLAADIEHLTHIPLGELLAQRHAAQSALPSSASHSLEQAEEQLAAAGADLRAARVNQTAAQADFDAAQPGRFAARRDPNRLEASRRGLDEATKRLAKAERHVDTAKAHVRASRGNAPDRAAAQARIAAIDRALDRRIETAVKHPAGYLTQTLGKRPRTDAERWDKAATSIETYRHHHLGTSPEHGRQPGHGLEQAIGTPPDHHALRLRFWKQTQRHVDEYLSRSTEREQALQRTR